MRIGIIGHHVAPIAPPFAGGMESLTWYLTRWLAQRGHEVVLHAPYGSDVAGAALRPLDLAPRLSGEARSDVSMPPADFMAVHHAYQQLMVELIANGDEFDVLHLQSLHYLPVAMAELLPVPAVLTLHTPPTPWLESAIAARPLGALRFSAVSQATARLWHPLPIEAVVPNGVDPEVWRPGPGGDAAVWCGRGVPEKAPHLAIDAARAAGLPIRLAGPIVDRRYWEAAVTPRLGPDARYVGHLDHDDLGTLLGSSRVAIVTPEWEEPFGLTALEAMACGTPVASFARGGLKDVVDSVTGYLAAPGSVADLAHCARAASDLDRDAVRERALVRFGIDAMGARYEALFESMVHGAPRLLAEAA